ncbi:FAD:protein FMN transferase [Pedobacter yulinensis]|uniref:FAD:protein FMN transferase n=1 Tax=Pedobacter yulinensis TaxID=2126353 RepID=A0A2T3HL95_9SPHI|nr:FAD:protein FMN transferase [Pedobacter yulinensis]PST83217.1 FAD:protein FMN transferase [Pedobacter yulinensis]
MKQLRLFLFPALLCLSLTDKQQVRRIYFEGPAQGTSYHITYYAPDTLLRQEQADSLLAVIDASMSLYKPASLISRFNAGQQPVELDEHFLAVAQKAIEIGQKTGGLFDMSIQPLTQLWGFGTSGLKTQPDSAAVQRALSAVGPSKLKLEGRHLRKMMPGAGADVNGIAQGYTVDALAKLLASRGVSNFLVEVGGEIRVSGRKLPSGESMRIGIESPEADGAGVHPMQRILTLAQGAITTSGSYRKFYERGGRHINHIISPKTGYPVSNELISVTVYAPDAMTADGYDNALMLMGLEQALAFVEKQPELAAYFIYRKPDGNTADTASTRFATLLQPKDTR